MPVRAFIAVEIVKLDALLGGLAYEAARQENDAPLWGLAQQWQEPLNQEEVAKVVDDELLFEAVHGLELLQPHDARIADYRIQ